MALRKQAGWGSRFRAIADINKLVHFVVMFRFALAIGLAALASCSSKPDAKPDWPLGWSYDTNPGWPGAIYRFADKTTLYGRCHGGAVFSLDGGDYQDDARQFDLIIDGKLRTFSAFADRHHGLRALIVDERDAVQALTRAEKITFRVGSWERSLPGSPLIARLVRQCRDFPKR